MSRAERFAPWLWLVVVLGIAGQIRGEESVPRQTRPESAQESGVLELGNSLELFVDTI
jgi:hypothetical protein